MTFTPTDAANYTTATATVAITVTKATPVITWPTPADIVYGTALSATQLNATATVAGTFVYTPAAGTVLNAGAAQTLSVTFTPTDAANYTTATTTVTITVTKATPVITWAAPADIVYGTALERDAAERDDDRARHVRLHAGRGHGALNAGAAQTLSVTFTPTDAANYTTATTTVAITVTKATPDDHLGDARRTSSTARRSSATQLNATATVAGTFVYTPAAARCSTPARRRRCR